MSKKRRRFINDLGLNHCADSPLLLISGGERKHTSIGMEIISDPEILLIDKGTSGLDSTAAVSFIRLIKSIASGLPIPVVQAIHQPSTAVFTCSARSYFYLMATLSTKAIQKVVCHTF